MVGSGGSRAAPHLPCLHLQQQAATAAAALLCTINVRAHIILCVSVQAWQRQYVAGGSGSQGRCATSRGADGAQPLSTFRQKLAHSAKHVDEVVLGVRS